MRKSHDNDTALLENTHLIHRRTRRRVIYYLHACLGTSFFTCILATKIISSVLQDTLGYFAGWLDSPLPTQSSDTISTNELGIVIWGIILIVHTIYFRRAEARDRIMETDLAQTDVMSKFKNEDVQGKLMGEE